MSRSASAYTDAYDPRSNFRSTQLASGPSRGSRKIMQGRPDSAAVVGPSTYYQAPDPSTQVPRPEHHVAGRDHLSSEGGSLTATEDVRVSSVAAVSKEWEARRAEVQ